MKLFNINIKCNSEEQAKAIVEHFNNEHNDGHRYAYLMFDSNTIPEIVEISRELDSINIKLNP